MPLLAVGVLPGTHVHTGANKHDCRVSSWQMGTDSLCLKQEKAGAEAVDAAVAQQEHLQFPSLKSALNVDWSSLHPRRSHRLICLLAGDHHFFLACVSCKAEHCEASNCMYICTVQQL